MSSVCRVPTLHDGTPIARQKRILNAAADRGAGEGLAVARGRRSWEQERTWNAAQANIGPRNAPSAIDQNAIPGVTDPATQRRLPSAQCFDCRERNADEVLANKRV